MKFDIGKVNCTKYFGGCMNLTINDENLKINEVEEFNSKVALKTL